MARTTGSTAFSQNAMCPSMSLAVHPTGVLRPKVERVQPGDQGAEATPPALHPVDEPVTAMDDTAGWLKPPTRRRSGSAGDSLDPGAVAARIQELLCDSRSAWEALVRLRGAQAAYFRAGWLVDFSPQLIDPDSGLARVGPCTRRQHGARLRRLCTPRSTAAMTLRLAADLRGQGLASRAGRSSGRRTDRKGPVRAHRRPGHLAARRLVRPRASSCVST